MKISDKVKQRVIASTMPFVEEAGRSAHLASQVIQNTVRYDAVDDEKGRWVTTEEGNHMFIDGEGVPTKGNPHVLAAARGEKGPKKASASKQAASGNKAGYGHIMSASARERSMAGAFLHDKTPDGDAARKALKWNDKEHYESLSDRGKELLNEAFNKANGLDKEISSKERASDIDKEISKLEKSAAKAAKYGNNESGDFETVDKIEKKIQQLEQEKASLAGGKKNSGSKPKSASRHQKLADDYYKDHLLTVNGEKGIEAGSEKEAVASFNSKYHAKEGKGYKMESNGKGNYRIVSTWDGKKVPAEKTDDLYFTQKDDQFFIRQF